MRKLCLWAFLFLIIKAWAAEESPFTKKVKLSWDEVEKSQAYELEVYKGDVQIVKETIVALSWESRLEPGDYKYRVRALDEFSRYGVWTIFEEFSIKAPENRDKEKVVTLISRSSFSLGLHYGTFDYGSEISGLGFGRASSANDFSIEAEARYWFKKNFSVGLEASYTMGTLSGVDVNYADYAAAFRYSLLKDSRFYIYPVLSVDYLNTPEISSSTSTTTSLEGNLIRTIGLGLGAELGWHFSDTWVAGASLRYIWPFSYSGSDVEKGVADSSTFYRYGLELSYFFRPEWSVGLEYGYEYRKVSYESGLGRNNLYKDVFRFGLNLKALLGDSK